MWFISLSMWFISLAMWCICQAMWSISLAIWDISLTLWLSVQPYGLAMWFISLVTEEIVTFSPLMIKRLGMCVKGFRSDSGKDDIPTLEEVAGYERIPANAKHDTICFMTVW